jgi:hypothetical protein
MRYRRTCSRALGLTAATAALLISASGWASVPLDLQGAMTPDVASVREIDTSLGRSLEFLGYTRRFGADGACVLTFLFHCQDRPGQGTQIGFRLRSRFFEDLVMPDNVDCTDWPIGAVKRISWQIDIADLPRGACSVYAEVYGKSNFLATVSLWDEARQVPQAEFESEGKGSGLETALAREPGVAVFNENTVCLACQEAPWPEDKVSVTFTQASHPGVPYRIRAEVYDSYGSVNMTGNLEQRVLVDGRAVHRHDIGTRFGSGWYPVELVHRATGSAIELAFEVAPLVPLGPWGWGKASRTRIRNVTIAPCGQTDGP